MRINMMTNISDLDGHWDSVIVSFQKQQPVTCWQAANSLPPIKTMPAKQFAKFLYARLNELTIIDITPTGYVQLMITDETVFVLSYE